MSPQDDEEPPTTDTFSDAPAPPDSTEEETDPPCSPVRPYWIPRGIDFESFTEEQQMALTAIVNPAYRGLVLGAASGLEQSTGTTIVFLLWMELLKQLKLGASLSAAECDQEGADDLEKDIARYFQIVGAKTKASQFFLRLNEYRAKCGSIPGSLDPIQSRFWQR